MQTVYFYTHEQCALCVEAELLLDLLKHDFQFHLEKRDIYSNDEWLERYHLIVPAISINGEEITCETMNYEILHDLFSKHLKAQSP